MVYCSIHFENHHGKKRMGACYLQFSTPKYRKKKLKEIIKENNKECKMYGHWVQNYRKNEYILKKEVKNNAGKVEF